MFKDTFDKNTILGLLLIVSMVGVYFFFTKKKLDKFHNETPVTTADTASKNTEKGATALLDTNATKTIAIDTTSISNLPNEQKVLKNELVKIEISTLGAQINNAELFKHKEFNEGDVSLLSKDKTSWNYQYMTPTGAVNTSKLSFNVTNSSDTAIELTASNGTKVVYTLTPNTYVLKQKWTFANLVKNSAPILKVSTQMNHAELNLQRERQYSTVYFLKNGEDKVDCLDKNKNEEKEELGGMNWIAFGQQFFNTSIIPSGGFSKGKMTSYHMENDTNYVKKYTAEMTLTPQENYEITYFIGPSEYKLLKKLGGNLDLIVPLSQDFILFRWMKIFNIYLIIPLFDFLSRFFSNYGIIILIMTLIIKLVLMPLSFKMYRSGVAMKILKPELDALKKKHGDDQQKYAQEQMKLYNEVGVNPLGAGCLPMILQMPILFAMFNFFPSSIELRHQPFLWAKDLSTFDSIANLPFPIPFYGDHISLFALLMSITQIATSVYSQRLQPSSPQADQMKMMAYIMPVMFLFMFNKFPAALTFYYLLQNLFSIFQQWFVTKFMIDETKVKAEMELARKTPKKKGIIQQKLQDIADQAEQQKKLQQNNTKK